MSSSDRSVLPDSTADAEELAAQGFLRERGATFDGAQVPDTNDESTARAARDRVERAWRAVGEHAGSPELMGLREQAMARARRARARRWYQPAALSRPMTLAASLAAALVVAGVWTFSDYGPLTDSYRTGIGEQRVIELEDHSKVTLDAKTKIRVRFSRDARVIEMSEGQAQFSVAKDATRPFKVIAGEHAVVALGTVFTVEYLDNEFNVAMLEGRVAITGVDAPLPRMAAPKPLEISAGEALQVSNAGAVTVIPKADLSAATAWRQGRVIFHDEPLGSAVRRINRYSKVQVQVDDAGLAQVSVSGVFEVGDTRAFAQAVQSYLPVSADYSDPNTILLSPK
ncbi:FecR family protein [Steroidobacter sp.]|uniref:FecR family protein n=1 Tax=Steroidobacter sp. TaxID=1978227 RepID=UPI001A54147C|nr:FecR domain-containing protein [Steroidobacter sp.]MBL8270976.1 FecR domain-containing protein [Steroidobacter sp.]